MLECKYCEWQGHIDDLESHPDYEPTSINDFTHCPECNKEEFHDLDNGGEVNFK